MITNILQDGGQAKTLTWQKIGSQADEWKQGLVQLSPSKSYQVRKQSVHKDWVFFLWFGVLVQEQVSVSVQCVTTMLGF